MAEKGGGGAWHGLLRELAPIPARLALGALCLHEGAQHLLGWWGGSAAAEVGARIAAGTLLLGGIAVLLGLCARLGALGLATLPAALMVGSSGASEMLVVTEGRVALLGLALTIVVGGAGRLSLDGLIKARRRGA